MKIENPEITLADEARCGVKEEVRSGFLDWLFEFNVTGDDGELYALGGSILSLALEKIDLATLCMAKGTGSAQRACHLRRTVQSRVLRRLLLAYHGGFAGRRI